VEATSLQWAKAFRAATTSRALRLLAFLAGALATACAAPAPASPELEHVCGVDGAPFDPFAGRSGHTLVLLFVDLECPISNAYAPEVRRMAQEYGPRGADFVLVYAVPGRDADAVRKHVAEYDYGLPAALDPAHELVRRAGVGFTPEVAVFRPDGSLGYRGRIDDRHVVLGSRRAQPTRRDLREALDAILAGREPEVARTEPIGCPIPEVEPAEGS
jgi:hypothetical protein